LPRAGTTREFLYSFLSSDSFAAVFETLVTGTSGSHQRVKSEGLLNMNALVPNRPVIDCFTGAVRPLLQKADHGREETATLVTLRDTLLPKLISGELRIKDAERIVGDVA